MRQLLYASNTLRDLSDVALENILASSRKNNVKAGITGVLLYIEGGFMQILEGDAPAITETFDRISKDRRHWKTTVLLDRDAPRAFGEWSMGFTRLAKDSDPAAFALTEDAIHGRLKPGASAEIVTLLRTFYRINS
jgi:Sensors of blue-light using FAD